MNVSLGLWTLRASPTIFQPPIPTNMDTASSIVAGSLGLAASVAKSVVNLTIFVRDVRDARGDIEGVCAELNSLKMILELLADDVEAANNPLPTILEARIKGILKNCSGVLDDIQECIDKYQSSRGTNGVKWAAIGKADMARLRSSLEAHKATLDLALDMISVCDNLVLINRTSG